MKTYRKIILFMLLLAAAGCAGSYDDARIREDLDEIGRRVETLERSVAALQAQMDVVTQLFGASFVSFISTDADGNYVITYMDHGGERRTVTVATGKDVVKLPIIGAAQDEDGVWYWRQTTDNGKTWEWILVDGKQVPVGGETPQVGIDDGGYWTVNGRPVTDAAGNKLLAVDVSDTLFERIWVDEATGEAVFVLAGGQELRIALYEALSLSFDAAPYTALSDYAAQVKIRYTVGGSQAEGAIVDLFTAWNVEASVDTSVSTITVSLREGAAEGNILVMAHANGHTLLKPLFFTYGTAEIQDPLHDGSTADVVLEGESSVFDIQVSASIDYAVTVSGEAAGWLAYDGTRALQTTTHRFMATAWEDAGGTVRSGEIRFANELYGISASIGVKQYPKVPEQGEQRGIASATDLLAFANAVNGGFDLSRWQNEAGDVVLLNDIDMSAVSEWTPIGSIDGSNYDATTPYTVSRAFTGTFDGQGYAIRNLKYTADAATGRYGYALFAAVENAAIRNVVLGDPETPVTWTVSGAAPAATVCATLAAYVVNSTVENCVNYYNVDFTGDCSGVCFISGLLGAVRNTKVGGSSRDLGCANYGFVRTGKVSNTAAGATGVQTAGVVGLMSKDAGNLVQYCVNYGHISSPTGRTGGVVGTMFNGNVKNCDNRGTVEDDAAGQFTGNEQSAVTYKRMGGIVGGTDDLTKTLTATVENCTNYGNVLSHIGCRAGGFIGHSNVQVIGCANLGAILGDIYDPQHGPGWACGYSGNSKNDYVNVRDCSMGGYVGSYSQYKDDPTSAPAATHGNALGYNNDKYYNPSLNN